jgi:hypothetical protein
MNMFMSHDIYKLNLEGKDAASWTCTSCDDCNTRLLFIFIGSKEELQKEAKAEN